MLYVFPGNINFYVLLIGAAINGGALNLREHRYTWSILLIFNAGRVIDEDLVHFESAFTKNSNIFLKSERNW